MATPLRSFLQHGRTETIPRWPLGTLRIYGGLIFGSAGFVQLMGRPAWLVPPQSHLDSLVVIGVELVVGTALTLGVATRAAALVGVALMASRFYAAGFSPASLVSPGPNTAITMLLLTVILGRAGRVWGLDRQLAARWPRNPLW
ncbi:MAG TPA: hypothetical protein VEU74_08780 [Gemmatimonadales bacterium]|nr:hypothetical protein [Gemmatimonadales bacterium]